MEIPLLLFGPYRAFGERITLILPENATAADIRPALKASLSVNEGLVDSSRFATEDEVLTDSTPLRAGAELAVIPPVSGG